MHEADERRLVADDERGDAPDVVRLATLARARRAPSRARRRTRSRRTPRRRRRRASVRSWRSTASSRMSRPSSWRSGEQGAVHGEELVGTRVADDDAGLQGEQPAVVVGSSHTSAAGPPRRGPGRARTGTNVRPSRRRPQPGEHVLVGVAGEGAAVVPGDGEGGHDEVQPPCDVSHSVGVASRRVRTSASGAAAATAAWPAAETDAERRSGDDVGRVVDPHVDPAGGDDDGERVIQAATADRRRSAPPPR